MKKIIPILNMKRALLCFILVFSFSFSYGQSWVWGREGVVIGMKNTLSIDVATDIAGNAFIAGVYTPGIIFWPDTLIASNLTDIYFVKYNSSGTVLWAKDLQEGDYPLICSDASNNIILYGIEGALFTKFNNNGNIIFTTTVRDSLGYVGLSGITTDKFKNIFVTGGFTRYLKIGSTTLVGRKWVGTVFTAKFDSNGNVLWAKQGFDLSKVRGNNSVSNAITTDINGNSIITGGFIDSVAFGTDTLTSLISDNSSTENLFIVKYDPAGICYGQNNLRLLLR